MNNSGLPKLNLTASPKGPDQLATAAQPHPPERRNIAARLEALSNLQPSWYEGHGESFNPADLAWLADQFTQRYPTTLPSPQIAPTVEGKIELEWDHCHHVIFLEINLTTKQAEWFSYQPPNENEVETTLDLRDPADWQWLAHTIQAKLDNHQQLKKASQTDQSSRPKGAT